MNPRRSSIIVLFAMLFMWLHAAYGTFSIVAVDTITGEIGSAGASCITGSRILSDVVLGYGGIHTQAYYLAANQQYARSLMLLGLPPEAIIDSVVAHDAQNNPGIRQYGIVELPHGRSAAYTGTGCQDWKGHRTGPGYSIQGNILLGPQIVDSMEYAFLNTPGMLSDKLMAALQAAKRPGADTRCLGAGKSAISSFIRVARPWDSTNVLYLDLNVNSTSGSTDPIDVLQQLYDQWHHSTTGSVDPFLSSVAVTRDTLTANGTDTTLVTVIPRNNQGQPVGAAAQLWAWLTPAQGYVNDPVLTGDSIFTSVLTAASVPGVDTLTVFSAAGAYQGELAAHPIIHYQTAAGVSDPSRAAQLPTDIALRVFPNPFNSVVRISLELAAPAHIELAIFNLGGQRAATLQDVSRLAAGTHTWLWNASQNASGMYFVRLHANNQTLLHKILFLK